MACANPQQMRGHDGIEQAPARDGVEEVRGEGVGGRLL
jgi:hypothetical protein